jgi:hypothetical protein
MRTLATALAVAAVALSAGLATPGASPAATSVHPADPRTSVRIKKIAKVVAFARRQIGVPDRRNKESLSAQGTVSQARRIGLMSTRRRWKFRTAPATAILDQPDAMRQESWHTSAHLCLQARISIVTLVCRQNPVGVRNSADCKGAQFCGCWAETIPFLSRGPMVV